MIPDEAVEAAARELFFQHSNTNGPSLSHIWDEALNEDLKSPFMRDARAALEAAAPHMLAEAWDEGRVVGMMDPHRIEQSIKLNAPEFAQVANPYRNHPVIPEAAVEA